ncbi:TonB family protein [Spirosoma lacussanchae]|uniref:TonB family protein n=1 Tax=Spirosoma lacussanchae TaxID=1884249 RepID=UPI001107D7DF|nr:TonB family protein [Spirosoma lacussanchae]
MKLFPFILLFLLTISSLAQPVAYQSFETDSAAEPRGGMPSLSTFLQTNLRKPIEAEAQGIGGRVVLSGIVESDGRLSDIKVVQSLRPDCDREAIRVFSRFQAWRPAYKNGKAVRQFVTIPVTFKANKPFPYVNGNRISYYDANQNLLPDSSDLARYKQLTPTDSNGLPNGNIMVYQLKRQVWKEQATLPFVRKRSDLCSRSGKPVYMVGVVQQTNQWQGRVADVDETGTLVRQAFYNNGERVGYQLDYYSNGLVAQRSDDANGLYVFNAWHPNGQIKQIWTVDKPKPGTPKSPDQVMAYWDSTGRQLVNEGNGSGSFTELVQSKNDSTRQTLFIEEGAYAGGLREGRWIGHYADGSYFYEERYEKGICQAGKAITAGQDTVRYTQREQQPEFAGGMQAMGQFLASTLRYPPDAQRAHAQGQVMVSFVVCADGTLCDYEVIKPLHPAIDQEALRIVKAMNGRWKPGVQRGQNVRVRYRMPLNFMLE